ncbi:MAG: hypothetical protein AAFV53_36130 [Myxococcota bacterium]
MSAPRLRWGAKGLGALAILFALFVIVGEGVARLAHPCGAGDALFHPLLSAPDGLFVDDPHLLRWPTPRLRATVAAPGCVIDLRFDDRSARGQSNPDARWLALGDERTMAITVDEPQTWTAQLAAHLETPIINAGVHGDSTWQALGRYQRYVGVIDLEQVIVMLHVGTDLIDNSRFHRQLQVHQAMAGAEEDAEFSPFERQLFHKSALYAWWNLAYPWRGLGPTGERWRAELLTFHRGFDDTRILPQTRDALRRLRDATAHNHDELLVAVLPHVLEVLPEHLDASLKGTSIRPEDIQLERPRTQTLRLLDELGVVTCDLTAALKGAREGGGDVVNPRIRQLTPEGHRVVSEQVRHCLGR